MVNRLRMGTEKKCDQLKEPAQVAMKLLFSLISIKRSQLLTQVQPDGVTECGRREFAIVRHASYVGLAEDCFKR